MIYHVSTFIKRMNQGVTQTHGYSGLTTGTDHSKNNIISHLLSLRPKAYNNKNTTKTKYIPKNPQKPRPLPSPKSNIQAAQMVLGSPLGWMVLYLPYASFSIVPNASALSVTPMCVALHQEALVGLVPVHNHNQQDENSFL